MPLDIVTVWDGTRQRGPYLGVVYDGPREAPVQAEDSAEIRWWTSARMQAKVLELLTEQPRTFLALLEALGNTQLYTRLNVALYLLKRRGVVEVVGAIDVPRSKRRVHRVYGVSQKP